MLQTIDRAWVKVWDPLVRFGHWALAVAFAAGYLSAEEESGDPSQLHVWSGYAVGTILAVRIVWGVIGSRHARFSDFAYKPMFALAYLGDLVRGHARRYLGHSPIGGAMVVALLVCLSGTVWTGLVAYGDTGRGRLVHSTEIVIAPAHADDGREAPVGENSERVVGELHGTLANITLGLVILHILGVGLASVMHRENLVVAMLTGRKRPEDDA
jgi:cytochrome b